MVGDDDGCEVFTKYPLGYNYICTRVRIFKYAQKICAKYANFIVN